jgi:hypothetical protein
VRFTNVREQEVIDTLREKPEAHIVFPERAYRPDGRILIHRNNRNRFMTRYLFELLIQPDLERLSERVYLLQACDTTGCQNPFHYRGSRSPKGEVAIHDNRVANAVKTHCVHGHPFTPENTRVDSRGKRCCRACDRIRKASR